MWESHQITTFLDLGKEKALTVFPPTLVWFYLVNRISCPWVIFSDVGRIMRSHSSLPVYIIARIALGVSRLLATLCDNFWGSVCAGQGMLSRPSLTVYIIAGIDLGIMRYRPSLTVYIIAHIDLGVLRHCAASCDIVRQLSGGRFAPGRVPMTFCGVYRTFRARRTVRHPAKTIKWAKVHSERIDRNHHL